MASDVEDLTTFYADLPSIFEKDATNSIDSTYNTIVTNVDTEKSYQPIFGSFLFTESDPLSKAAFVTSPSQSSEVEETEEQVMDKCALGTENKLSNGTQVVPSSPRSHLAPEEDFDDSASDDQNHSEENSENEDIDEDDFDGIPIRHASIIMQKKLNGDSDSILNNSVHDRVVDEIIHKIENSQNGNGIVNGDNDDDDDLEDESFLNGFTDDQHESTTIVPSLFKDIPDIDDPNEHEEDYNDQVPFDHMDMYNQSESLRSSSPDSLLSSSHLRDEQDDDENNIDDDVAQWNDDMILNTNSSTTNSQVNRPVLLSTNPFDQVNFIDSSRSNSRCSNVSSHLSFGYNDQARAFMSDDGLVTSSDSDDDDDEDDDNNDHDGGGDNNDTYNNVDMINTESDTLNRDDHDELTLQVNLDEPTDDEDLRLEVNLDDRQSVSSLSKSNSIRSMSPNAQEAPIVDIDEDHDESRTLQIAPMAALDDEDDDDLQGFVTEQSFLPTISSNIKNLIESKHNQGENDIIRDIINMRHLLEENSHDDEFLAVMHNPRIFEEILYDHEHENSIDSANLNSVDNDGNDNDDDQSVKDLDLVKQVNALTDTLQSSSRSSIDNQIKNDSFEHHQNVPQASSQFGSGNDDTRISPLVFSSSRTNTSTTTTTTTTTTATPIINNSSSSSSSNSLTTCCLTQDGIEEKKNDACADVDNTANVLNTLENDEQLQEQQVNTINFTLNQLTNTTIEKQHSIMSTDNESDDDSELLKTLSQLHSVISTNISTKDINRVESHNSSYPSDINESEKLSHILSETAITRGNEAEILNKESRENTSVTPSASYITDTVKNFDEEQEEERVEKKKVIFHKNHNNDDDSDDKQKEKYENSEEKRTSTFFSLTSTTSSTSLHNDSHATVGLSDHDTIVLLPKQSISSNEISESTSLSNQLITDDLQISNTKLNMDHLSNDEQTHQTTIDLFDPFTTLNTVTGTTTATTTIATDMFDSILNDSKNDTTNHFDIKTANQTSNPTVTKPFTNYDFDELWNQSVAKIESTPNHEIKSDNHYDPNPFTWDLFFNNNNDNNNNNNNNKTSNKPMNSSNENQIVPDSTITWESLFGDERKKEEEEEAADEDENDLTEFLNWILSHMEDVTPDVATTDDYNDDYEANHNTPVINFTSTQNLESIVKDIQISSMPFDPIPSPPLHVDHSVSNPMINGIHHELFPINELEQFYNTPGPQSMTIYEEDEEDEELEKENEDTNPNAEEVLPSDAEIDTVVQKLVSNILQKALEEVGEKYDEVEHLVDRILTQAIYDVHNEDINVLEAETNDTLLPIENLATIINDHTMIDTSNKQVLDPFDQQFDSVWSKQFQEPSDPTNENLFENETKSDIDPWLAPTTETNNETDSMTFFKNNLNESDLFSSTTNPRTNVQEIEEDEAKTFSEYIPPPILANTPNKTGAINNMMMYTLTAPFPDDSGDDSSMIDDYLLSRKNESPLAQETNIKSNEEPVKRQALTLTVRDNADNSMSNVFSSTARLSQFEAFASDQPLDSSFVNSANLANTAAQSNTESNDFVQFQTSVDDDTPWTNLDKPSDSVLLGAANKNEAWELEDTNEENFKSNTKYSDAFNDDGFSTVKMSDSQQNFFSDSFTVPTVDENNENLDDGIIESRDLQRTSKTLEHVENSIEHTKLPNDDSQTSEWPRTGDADTLEVNGIKPSFENIDENVTDHAEINTSDSDAADINVATPFEAVKSKIRTTESEEEREDLPSELRPFSDKTNMSTNGMPVASALMPLNNETKYKKDLRSESDITPTIQTIVDTKVRSQTDTQAIRPMESAFLNSSSNYTIDVDANELGDVISCVIDNTPVNIDAKTISPFKGVISSAGTLYEDNQTIVIAIYGCWLPDHRLREYRYIMDQLFYYVYHTLDKLVVNDYVLIYFHGATPKHRTPDLKFLRKCYQMINFRLRKNLRSVYVVHPTRWLRTIIALSRPFFSKKFYHKINYLYTIAELEKEFPHNRLSIPPTIEQTDWLYSQKYDRHNASLRRSIERSTSRSIAISEDESAA